MKIIIVEDEIHNQRMLVGMINALRPEWEIVASFVSISDTVTWMKNNPEPDLVFMDIQLVDGLCFSIFEKVKVNSPVIFTTAYDEYAIQAFKVNSIDYLLKPIKEEDLEIAIKKLEDILYKLRDLSSVFDYSQIAKAIQSGEHKYRKRFLISKGSSFIKICVEDIAYFYSENKISYVVTFKNEQHVLDLTLEKIAEELDPRVFYRANRQYIITLEAMHKVEAYFGGKLIVRLIPPFKDKITISRLKATDFKHWIDQ
jgi:two-component system, LytTR family, response regulator